MARAGLSREAVLAAATALADEHGLGAVSMRRLASELGVEAMSLYNHVAHKRDLHQGLSDRVWAEVDLALDATDWRAGVTTIASSAYHAMLAHPWFLSLPVVFGGVHRLHVINATLGHLRNGGVSAAAAFHAQHVLDGYVAGYAWQAIGYLDSDQVEERAAEMLGQVDPDALPHLMEHVHQHMAETPAGDGFGIGLALILDGLESGLS